jgi:hypothetical protein
VSKADIQTWDEQLQRGLAHLTMSLESTPPQLTTSAPGLAAILGRRIITEVGLWHPYKTHHVVKWAENRLPPALERCGVSANKVPAYAAAIIRSGLLDTYMLPIYAQFSDTVLDAVHAGVLHANDPFGRLHEDNWAAPACYLDSYEGSLRQKHELVEPLASAMRSVWPMLEEAVDLSMFGRRPITNKTHPSHQAWVEDERLWHRVNTSPVLHRDVRKKLLANVSSQVSVGLLFMSRVKSKPKYRDTLSGMQHQMFQKLGPSMNRAALTPLPLFHGFFQSDAFGGDAYAERHPDVTAKLMDRASGGLDQGLFELQPTVISRHKKCSGRDHVSLDPVLAPVPERMNNAIRAFGVSPEGLAYGRASAISLLSNALVFSAVPVLFGDRMPIDDHAALDEIVQAAAGPLTDFASPVAGGRRLEFGPSFGPKYL